MAKKGGIKKMAAASNDSNLYGALAYLLFTITGVIMYLAKPNDKYVRYHAIQAIILGVVLFAIGMVINAGALMIPMFGWIFGLLAGGVWLLVQLLIWLYCMWKAYSGEKFKVPVISELAEKNS